MNYHIKSRENEIPQTEFYFVDVKINDSSRICKIFQLPKIDIVTNNFKYVLILWTGVSLFAEYKNQTMLRHKSFVLLYTVLPHIIIIMHYNVIK
jgi:hypothetical protein